jgi:CMP-N-acetylneuraminic acid synthetase|tara:strand:- start:33 stop:722 length:690 start_codon:yes stop_codon:yes gene_type:complete
MKIANDVCVLVQARLGSERVPQKMIRPFAGTTLMDICLKKLSESKVIPKKNIFASVYEPELISIAKKHEINVFYRSKESADSEGTPMSLMYEWWDKLPYKYCILVNACAPFLSLETIEKFYEEYLKTSDNGLFGVVEKKNYFWNNKGQLITPWPKGQAVMNTKYVENTFEAAHCLYAGSMSMIGSGVWMGDFSRPGDIKLYNMEEKEVFDIDYEWQFLYYEKLYKLGVR